MPGKRRVDIHPQLKKRRKTVSAIEEIKFDFSAREEYLTGFHKRKLQRVKHAKEEALKKERVEKIEARRILREGRKADLEKHIESVNAIIRKQQINGGETDGEDGETDEEEWNGILEPATVDQNEEYMDEDRYTSVTVEAVNVTREGLHNVVNEVEQGNEERTVLDVGGLVSGISSKGLNNENTRPGKQAWTKDPPDGMKKKKKFRYESKAERKITRHKERLGNQSKAKARKK